MATGSPTTDPGEHRLACSSKTGTAAVRSFAMSSHHTALSRWASVELFGCVRGRIQITQFGVHRTAILEPDCRSDRRISHCCDYVAQGFRILLISGFTPILIRGRFSRAG